MAGIAISNLTKFGVTLTKPTTEDLAGFKALTALTNVPYVDQFPNIHPTAQIVRETSVTDPEVTLAGEEQKADFTINYIDDSSDAGQQLMRDAQKSKAIVYGVKTSPAPNNRVEYFGFRVLRAGGSNQSNRSVQGEFACVVTTEVFEEIKT